MAVALAPRDVVLRPAKGSDQGYVASTWIHNQDENSNLVDQVFERRSTRILVAHPAQNVDRILGWICFERPPRVTIVHMVYVRSNRRKRGLGTELLDAVVGERRLPIVLTAKEVPDWAERERRWTRMTLAEMLAP